jgi:hypothetical protein
MGYCFCTYFDHRYLDRGLVLYESLRKHAPNSTLYVLALSETCQTFLQRLRLPGLIVLSLRDIYQDEPNLQGICDERGGAAAVFTRTPFLIRHVLNKTQPGSQTIYLDADMMFFNDPRTTLNQSACCSVAITPHRFSPHWNPAKQVGYYNVGWVAFKNSTNGYTCLNWWADRCLEWCYDRMENGKFGDQKYLDDFATIVPDVLEISDIGVNCAPWNSSYKAFRKTGDFTTVNGLPLTLYHFSLVYRIGDRVIAPHFTEQCLKRAPGLIRNVYKPYARELARVCQVYGVPRSYWDRVQSLRPDNHKSIFDRDASGSWLTRTKRVITGEYVLA